MAALLEELDSDEGRTEVLPALMARACVAVLPITGAGLSFTDELRIPLGASDAMAARAERLQTTLGEGPCLAASATSTPLQTSGAEMAIRWPIFHRELVRQTSYRAIVSFPLQSKDREHFGALDLYAVDSDAFSDLILDQVSAEVAEPIASILFDDPSTIYEQGNRLPDWLASDAVMDRMTVWIAIGQLLEEGIPTNNEALATLRGYAFAHDTTIDELANQLSIHEIAPKSLLNP